MITNQQGERFGGSRFPNWRFTGQNYPQEPLSPTAAAAVTRPVPPLIILQAVQRGATY
jgi:hypothetical protein